MANTKSAIKNARKTSRRTARNRMVRSRLKTLAQKVDRLTKEGRGDEAQAAATAYASALDRAAKSHVIHRNAASRRKGGLSAVLFAKK